MFVCYSKVSKKSQKPSSVLFSGKVCEDSVTKSVSINITFISIHILDLITFYNFAHYSFLHFSPFSRMIFLSPKMHIFRISTKECFLVVNITCEMYLAFVFDRKFCSYRVLGWQLLSHRTLQRLFPMISTGFQIPEWRFVTAI